ALVLANSGISDKTFSGDGDITLTDYTPNKISFTVNCVAPQLMVLSELHYQPGWKAYLNESEIQITKVNHLLRGVEVPAGEYNMRFEIHPDTYFSSLTFVWIGNILTLTLLGVGFILEFNKRKQ
ncbi:YfhO family protein, partial [Patescibacteria group bacterium]|nr:YfhO family protein [Patescibacteria group bacterium]